jgi:hypothetical protein
VVEDGRHYPEDMLKLGRYKTLKTHLPSFICGFLIAHLGSQ